MFVCLLQVRMMEQRLAAADWTPSEATEQVSSLTSAVRERQQVITKLESEVQEQVHNQHFLSNLQSYINNV